MTPRASVPERLNAQWVAADREAESNKDSQSALVALEGFYRTLTYGERREANALIIEWALSSDPKRRYDGLALIGEFKIDEALPALRELAERAEESTGPSAPYDWAKVNRLIAVLASGRDHDVPPE
jgi:hypothetical protein